MFVNYYKSMGAISWPGEERIAKAGDPKIFERPANNLCEGDISISSMLEAVVKKLEKLVANALPRYERDARNILQM